MSAEMKALCVTITWIVIQIGMKIMKKITQGNNIYPVWVNIVAVLMTFYFICY